MPPCHNVIHESMPYPINDDSLGQRAALDCLRRILQSCREIGCCWPCRMILLYRRRLMRMKLLAEELAIRGDVGCCCCDDGIHNPAYHQIRECSRLHSFLH